MEEGTGSVKGAMSGTQLYSLCEAVQDIESKRGSGDRMSQLGVLQGASTLSLP